MERPASSSGSGLDGDHPLVDPLVDPDAYRPDRRKDVPRPRRGPFVLRFLAQDVASGLAPNLDRTLDLIHRTPAPEASA